MVWVSGKRDGGVSRVRIGDRVRVEGRAWRVRGVTPMGVTPTRVDLEDENTGERCVVDPAEIEPVDDDADLDV